MKEIFLIKIEKELNEEEMNYFKNLSEKDKTEIIGEHKQNIIEYFVNEDIEEKYIKTLKVYFSE